MTIKNFFSAIIVTLFLFSLNSCTQDTIFEETQETASNFKITPYSNSKSISYTANYSLSDNTSSVDVANDKINLEVPIPLSDFTFLGAYNISTADNAAIIYLIGRGATDAVVDKPINYVIQDEISISALNLDTNLLENGNGLRIFVMNNSQELAIGSEIYNCLTDRVDSADINAGTCDDNSKTLDGPHIYNGSIIL